MHNIKKPNLDKFPKIDGNPKKGFTYVTTPSIDGARIVQKTEMINAFVDRFGYIPSEVFYGKPYGSLLYAGPLTRDPSPPAEKPRNLQTESPAQPPLF